MIPADRIGQIFERLGKWRHFPKYQLERHVDVFFSLYLPEILEKKFNTKFMEVMIPEFPIKNSVWSNTTVNVDFVLFSAEDRTPYFVELKTDMSSINETQNEYLKSVCGYKFNKVLEKLMYVFKASVDNMKKYYHLFSLLRDLGFVDFDNKLQNIIYPENEISPENKKSQESRSDLIEKIEINEFADKNIKVVYLQPMEYKIIPGFEYIYFDNVIEYLGKPNDAFKKIFLAGLEDWKKEAGSIPPQQIVL